MADVISRIIALIFTFTVPSVQYDCWYDMIDVYDPRLLVNKNDYIVPDAGCL